MTARIDFPMNATETDAAELDAADELSAFRSRFHFPRTENGGDAVYLVGHSLGLQPITARDYVDRELEDWRRLGVEGHFEGENPWMPYHEALTDPLARLAGALPGEVVAMNTLTVNLHLMMVSFYRPTPGRNRILIEASAFPSDQYAVASQAAWHGYDPADSVIELRPREGEDTIRTSDIEDLIEREGKTIALVFLGGVNYLTGQAFDMERITRAGHRQGCVVGFDLAHAMGNLALRLHDWDVDFAVWCSYKYLNGGPGCVGAPVRRLVGTRQVHPVPDAPGFRRDPGSGRLAAEQSADPAPCGPARLAGTLRRGGHGPAA